MEIKNKINPGERSDQKRPNITSLWFDEFKAPINVRLVKETFNKEFLKNTNNELEC